MGMKFGHILLILNEYWFMIAKTVNQYVFAATFINLHVFLLCRELSCILQPLENILTPSTKG